MRKSLVVALMAVALAGCKGDAGPTGPAGPQGPQGAAGEPHYFSATADSGGDAGVLLPAEAGTMASPPAITCYIREGSGTNVWLAISTVTSSGYACGVTQSGNSLAAVVIGIPAFWQVLFVAVY